MLHVHHAAILVAPARSRIRVNYGTEDGVSAEPTAKHRVHVPAHLARREAPGGKLDDEGCGTGEVVVLPVGSRAGEPVVVVEAHPRGVGVDPTGPAALPPGPDEVHVLVVPDRDARPDPQDQVARDPRLAFRERPRPGIVGVPGTAAAAPAGRPVRVQVDAAPVLAPSGGGPVRVEVGNDPEVEPGTDALERMRNGDPRAFGAVDAAHHQYRHPARVPGVDRDDRTTALRPAQQHPRRLDGRGSACRSQRQRGQKRQKETSHTPYTPVPAAAVRTGAEPESVLAADATRRTRCEDRAQ